MSCIYGPHQCGTEDQGWVAHFLIKALKGEPITIYGDGEQVRDILYVDDLVDAFLLAQAHLPEISGQAFNIGGGPATRSASSTCSTRSSQDRPAPPGAVRRVASGRPALLRFRHGQDGERNGLEAEGQRDRRRPRLGEWLRRNAVHPSALSAVTMHRPLVAWTKASDEATAASSDVNDDQMQRA
jgi:hypothetical protein